MGKIQRDKFFFTPSNGCFEVSQQNAPEIIPSNLVEVTGQETS